MNVSAPLSYRTSAKSLSAIAAGAMCMALVVGGATLESRAAGEDGPKRTREKAKPEAKDEEAKWQDRLQKEDREALEENIGFAPPKIPVDLKWYEAGATNWEEQRGKVVVIQSWSSGSVTGRKLPIRVAESLKEYSQAEVSIIALHTPEDANGAEDYLKSHKPPEKVAVLIDAAGEFCDALGVFRVPVNIVIDRSGTVRYAGLNPKGLEQAVAKLVAEPFDVAAAAPKERPGAGGATADAAETPKPAAAFPPITGPVDNALDIRGKRAPEFFVEEWITQQPDSHNKVVILDFWGTWCGPCVQMIPHMNDLQTQFSDNVVCVGVSDESESKFHEGLKKKNLKLDGFKYALALDPTKKMYSAIRISAVPHCIVMSKDWVVRWQGHPAALTAKTLDQIVKADGGETPTAPVKPAGKKTGKKRGWT